ncbi:hypothetical protein G5A97_08810 [[Clostridium] symbiosum]|nr:hypothetical protein [[Clostridium] symbiosum]
MIYKIRESQSAPQVTYYSLLINWLKTWCRPVLASPVTAPYTILSRLTVPTATHPIADHQAGHYGM